MGPVKYAQKFRKDWLQDPKLKDWLLEVPGDSRRARCRYCRTELSAKHVDLVAHAATKKHVSAAAPFSSGRQTTLQVERKSDRSRTAEGSLAMFICAHSAMLASDHLGELCRNQFRDSEGAKHLQLHRSKCSALIKNVLSPHFVDELLSDLGSGSYSLILDESTDISVTKLLGVVIVYYSEKAGKVVSTFLSLVELTDSKAQSIVDAVKMCLAQFGIDLQRMVGIGTDNASVMIGVNNGVYQKLKADVPNLLLVRCVCHSLNLAVSSAVAEALPRNLEFLVSEIYNWFSRSPSRQQSYRDLYRALYDGHDPLKIVQSCSTRWLSIETAVRRVLDQWEALKSHFGEARMSEKCYTAELLHSMMRDPTNLAYLVFVKPILSEVQRVNKAFESNSADSLKLLSDLTLLTEGLTKKLVLPTCQVDPLSASVDAYVDPRANLGYEVERTLQDLRKTGFSEESERVFRERCIAFLYHLVRQLQQRLPDNVRILRQVSLLSVGNALCAVKESLVPLMEFMKLPQEKIAAIELQWDKLTLALYQSVDLPLEDKIVHVQTLKHFKGRPQLNLDPDTFTEQEETPPLPTKSKC
ncbi:hypothetical protein HPB47_004671 [Ixodes persulcatus]|uniref:Uncharacterized protein n=1 Tax=Ixodes persulcatus TaxID=34615 RepID=A0AC60PF21_IXOPE|nr:hypothetical protein HPB47_004671 [Ixodes persulcatus]